MYQDMDILDLNVLNLSDNLIDIRDKYEYKMGNIFKSINIPYNYLYLNPKDYLEFNKIYYIYCNNGSNSKRLCRHLFNLGYQVINLVGGYNRYLLK